jgi:hypothetical protein
MSGVIFDPENCWLRGGRRPFDPRVLSAIVGRKLFGELCVEIPRHLVQCFTNGRPRRIKHPSAFRAAPPHYILFFDPYRFARRTVLARCGHTTPHKRTAESTPSNPTRYNESRACFHSRFIQGIPRGTGRCQGSVKVNCCKPGVIGCFMPKTLMQSVINELQKERKRLEDELHRVAAALTAFGNVYMHGSRPTRKTRTISAAGRTRIAAAQRARWAKIKGQKVVSISSRKAMSPAGRSRIVAAQKARWAKWRAQKKA